MAINYLQHTYFFILLTMLIGQGDGQWKKSREVLRRDIKLYKKMSEKIKQEFEEYYSEYSNEPINDYFLEEIDYVQRKIEKYVRSKIKNEDNKKISFTHLNLSQEDNYVKKPHTIDHATNTSPKQVDKSLNIESKITKVTWPKFEDILLAIGKQYDWKNDRWIKVKAKMKEKKNWFNKLENGSDHQKHNFKYRIVKLNRAKSKRKIVIAVTAVR